MASACVDEFDQWLCTKLVNTDQDVFVSYIRGILEGDEAKDEKLEGLEGILIEIMSDNTSNLSHEIMDRWDKLSLTLNSEAPAELEVDVNAKLASIMERQTLSVVTERKITDEERQYKDAILAQYSHVSDNEDDDEEETKTTKAESVDVSPAVPTASGGAFVTKNTNAEDVARAEKDKRDKAKVETEKKKAADKANKEKQKQQQQERKEKEKKRTQKGERKR